MVRFFIVFMLVIFAAEAYCSNSSFIITDVKAFILKESYVENINYQSNFKLFSDTSTKLIKISLKVAASANDMLSIDSLSKALETWSKKVASADPKIAAIFPVNLDSSFRQKVSTEKYLFFNAQQFSFIDGNGTSHSLIWAKCDKDCSTTAYYDDHKLSYVNEMQCNSEDSTLIKSVRGDSTLVGLLKFKQKIGVSLFYLVNAKANLKGSRLSTPSNNFIKISITE